MGYREVNRVELQEVIRRWQAGESGRKIAKATGFARNTVEKYLRAAESLGLSPSGQPPTENELSQLMRLSDTRTKEPALGASEALLLAHREQIERWITTDRLLLTRVRELLVGQGCDVPYTSLRRFVINQKLGISPKTTVRLPETTPGDYAEMDFGRLGTITDSATGRKTTVWALVVVLSYSRHMFVWPVSHQRLEDVVEGLEAAWRSFGGVPRHLILDNFPAAVAAPDPLTPRLTHGFLQYAQFRGFLPDPARVRHPKDKPHVERAMPYVRERLFKGGSFRDLADLRAQSLRWCSEIAGNRVHGTTRRLPGQVFRDEERSHLIPLGSRAYLLPLRATLKVHLDHHVEFQRALYSVPCDLCPPSATVEVEATAETVRVYYRGKLVKTHPRQKSGGRSTDVGDFPAEKSAYALRAPERLCQQAVELGPKIGEFATRLLEGPFPWSRLRQAQKLLRLAETYTPDRLESACARALNFDLLDVKRVERILVEALDRSADTSEPKSVEVTTESPTPLSARFARPGSAFARPSGPANEPPADAALRAELVAIGGATR
jgi:transposase